MPVFVELTPGDAVAIGKSVVRMERKSGQRCRLAIQSAESVALVKDDAPTQLTRTPAGASTHEAPYLKPPTAR